MEADLNMAQIMTVHTMQENSLKHFCNREFPRVQDMSLISVLLQPKCIFVDETEPKD